MRRLALIAVATALFAGCGGEKTVTPTAETVVGEQPAAPPPPAQGNPEAGKTVFLEGGCGGCHVFTPAGAEAKGTVGPALDKLPEQAKTAGQPLEEFVRESIEEPDAYVEKGFPSGVMPAWSGDDQQLADLVAFLTKPA